MLLYYQVIFISALIFICMLYSGRCCFHLRYAT